jgi:hypothetical protein
MPSLLCDRSSVILFLSQYMQFYVGTMHVHHVRSFRHSRSMFVGNCCPFACSSRECCLSVPMYIFMRPGYIVVCCSLLSWLKRRRNDLKWCTWQDDDAPKTRVKGTVTVTLSAVQPVRLPFFLSVPPISNTSNMNAITDHLGKVVCKV